MKLVLMTITLLVCCVVGGFPKGVPHFYKYGMKKINNNYEIGFSLNQTDLDTQVVSNKKSFRVEPNIVIGYYTTSYEHMIQLEGTFIKEIILNEELPIDNTDIKIKYNNSNQQNITGGYVINKQLELIKDDIYVIERVVVWTNTILNLKYEYTFIYYISYKIK